MGKGDFTQRRAQMVEVQLATRGITDSWVLAAMGAVPRELFVPRLARGRAYDDSPLSIEEGQTISAPYIVARMSELLAPRPGMSVLEVGTGSGYQAAILAQIGCAVTSLERHAGLAAAARKHLEAAGLAERVAVFVGDGSLGWPAGAPYEGIMVTAATPAIDPALLEQLTLGGRLVAPVGTRSAQDLVLVVRRDDHFERHIAESVIFVPLIGAGGFER
jgi:protein-L-isoaspartate(D-aspartate) O-methyltransferase